jgi:hypothetical protein
LTEARWSGSTGATVCQVPTDLPEMSEADS